MDANVAPRCATTTRQSLKVITQEDANDLAECIEPLDRNMALTTTFLAHFCQDGLYSSTPDDDVAEFWDQYTDGTDIRPVEPSTQISESLDNQGGVVLQAMMKNRPEAFVDFPTGDVALSDGVLPNSQ